MPELIRLRDDEVAEDYLVLSGDDATVTDPCVSFRGYSDGRNTNVILNRRDVGNLVLALNKWLEETATDKPAQYERPAEGNTYPEARPSVLVPDYDAPGETGRAVSLSFADGLVFIECGRETVTAVNGDASARTWTVDGSTGVHANDLIRALAHLVTTDIVLREETLPARKSGGVLEYDSNNSGGGWWLKDEQWEALAEAGWTVHWGARNSSIDPLIQRAKTGDRWLGALATTAAKHVPSAAEGIAEWERMTGQCADDLGCDCCGPPHNFTYTPDNGSESRYISPEIPASADLSGVGYD